MVNSFTLGGINSEDYGIIITEPPKERFAELEVEYISIPGRSGDLTVNCGRYKNISIIYRCALLPHSWGIMRSEAVRFFGRIKRFTSYVRLEDSYSPESFRMAMAPTKVDVESIVEQAGIFDLTLTAKPQRFFKQGTEPIKIQKPRKIENHYAYGALPLITVYGSAPGTLRVGNRFVEILELKDQITLDSETMNAYRKVGDAAAENKNGDIYAMNFPELLPGDNAISWTGGISEIEITPRWWTL